MKHSVALANKLLRKLHVRTKQGPCYVYPPKEGMEDEAATVWVHTGVCPKCSHRAIWAGNCKNCGEELLR